MFGKYKFIARHNAYHGVTFGEMSATGVTANRKMFEPLVPGFRHIADPNCYRNAFGANLSEEEVATAAADALRRAIEFEGPETVAAFIAEPVQGAGGVIVPPIATCVAAARSAPATTFSSLPMRSLQASVAPAHGLVHAPTGSNQI